MLDSVYTTRFKKQIKLLQKRGMEMAKLHGVMEMIVKRGNQGGQEGRPPAHELHG